MPDPQKTDYVAHANKVERIAHIIVKAGCRPYAAAEALVAAGYEPSSLPSVVTASRENGDD